MTPKQLETFLHLSETLNFRKTAEHLYLSQTAVTFQIRNLEEELDVRLFDRNKKAVSLTPAGMTFRGYAERILSLMNEAVSNTAAVASGYTGLISVGFCIDTNKAGVADFVKSFTSDNPQIRLNMHGGYPETLMQKLQFDQCDIFFTPYFKGLETEELAYYRVGTYRQVAAFNKEHRFSLMETVRFEDFAGENLIGVTNDNIQLEFTEEFIARLRNKNIKFSLMATTDNIDTVFLMLDANMGITVIPEYFSERLAASSRIRMCRIDEELNGTDLVAVWKTKNSSEQLKLFIKYMEYYFPSEDASLCM